MHCEVVAVRVADCGAPATACVAGRVIITGTAITVHRQARPGGGGTPCSSISDDGLQ